MNNIYGRILPFVLVASVILVTCSDDPAVAIRYDAEKKFYAAQRALEQSQASDNRLTSTEARMLCPLYRELIDVCFQGLESVKPDQHPIEFNDLQYMAFTASLRLSDLFFSLNLYDSSVYTLNVLLKIPLTKKQTVSANVALGQTLQAAGNWAAAVTAYDRVIQDQYPPLDDAGEIIFDALLLPLTIFRTVLYMEDRAATGVEFRRAEDYYLRLIADHPRTRLEAAGRLALADLYDEAGQWQNELTQLHAVSDPAHPGYIDIMTRIADLYGGRLQAHDTALAIYNHLFEGLSPNDTAFAPVLLLKMGLAEVGRKQYSQARTVLDRLKKDYPKFFDSTPMPQYTIARSHELEGNWPRAETEYSLLIEKYRGSDEAMMALLYLFDHLKSQGRQAEAARWYQAAIEYFDDVAATAGGTPVEAKTLFYRAELLRRNNRPDSAAMVLVSVFEKFPGTVPGRRAMVAAAELYRDELNDPARADSLLQVLNRSLARGNLGTQSTDLLAD